MEKHKSHRAKPILKRNHKVGGISIPNFRAFYKSTAVSQCFIDIRSAQINETIENQ